MHEESLHDDIFRVALTHFQSGQLTLADQLCSQILALQPRHPEALHLRGGIALRLGRFPDAEKFMEKSIQSKPDDANFYQNLGIALDSQGKLHHAAAAYQKSIALRPNAGECREMLNSTLEEVRRLDAAVKEIEDSKQVAAIRVSDEERGGSGLTLRNLNLAERLYQRFGYLLIEDVFTERFIDTLHAYFKITYSDYFIDQEIADALQVGDRRRMATTRLDGPLNDVSYYANPFFMPLLARLLGESFIILSLGSVISLPGAKPQHVHSDHTALFDDDAVDATLPSFAVTVAIPLIEMNSRNGTTRIFPGTHRSSAGVSDDDNRYRIDPVVRKGSCLLFDYRVAHAGTGNVSDNVRPLMYNVYSRPWFSDCRNYTKQRPLVVTSEAVEKIPAEYRSLFTRMDQRNSV